MRLDFSGQAARAVILYRRNAFPFLIPPNA
jgi:hypothetical protein